MPALTAWELRVDKLSLRSVDFFYQVLSVYGLKLAQKWAFGLEPMQQLKHRTMTFLTLTLGAMIVLGTVFWAMRANANAFARTGFSANNAVAVAVIEPAAASNTINAALSEPNQNMDLCAAVTNVPVESEALLAEQVWVLNANRQFALGMIETANNDCEIGRAGEVSRYQIMPSVWKKYSHSRLYQSHEVSVQVAQQHWLWLYENFKKRANREPTDFDMYVLWNTRYNYYSSRDYDPARLGLIVRDRAQRFVNLVARGTTGS